MKKTINNQQESIGVNPQKFEIILHEDFEKYKYILGSDSYEENKPLNTYNRIRKFLGLKYKVKESQSYAVTYRLGSDGSVEYLNRKQ